MKTEIIDLYEYFNVKKPEGARGYLATYVAALSPEIDPGRKLLKWKIYCLTGKR